MQHELIDRIEVQGPEGKIYVPYHIEHRSMDDMPRPVPDDREGYRFLETLDGWVMVRA